MSNSDTAQGERGSERRPVTAFFETAFELVRHPRSFPAFVTAMIEDSKREATRADKAEQRAGTDALTQLPNRGTFDDQMKKAISLATRREDLPVSLIIIDVDHFKTKVNDVHGHPAGDAVLKTVGKVLNNHHRTEDMVARIGTEGTAEQIGLIKQPARYGGEEFGVILLGCSLEDAKIIAQEIRHDIATSPTKLPLEKDGQTHISVTASLGVATYDHVKDGNDQMPMIGRADAAMYIAKQMGRNQVGYSTPMGAEILPRDVPATRQPRIASGFKFGGSPGS